MPAYALPRAAAAKPAATEGRLGRRAARWHDGADPRATNAARSPAGSRTTFLTPLCGAVLEWRWSDIGSPGAGRRVGSPPRTSAPDCPVRPAGIRPAVEADSRWASAL